MRHKTDLIALTASLLYQKSELLVNKLRCIVADAVSTENENGNHKCIACGICQNNCPNNTIEIVAKKIESEDGKTKRVLDRYMYDLGACTFCQLCVSTCPHNAIEFTNEFEQAVFSREKLVKQLNNRPETATPKNEISE